MLSFIYLVPSLLRALRGKILLYSLLLLLFDHLFLFNSEQLHLLLIELILDIFRVQVNLYFFIWLSRLYLTLSTLSSHVFAFDLKIYLLKLLRKAHFLMFVGNSMRQFTIIFGSLLSFRILPIPIIFSFHLPFWMTRILWYLWHLIALIFCIPFYNVKLFLRPLLSLLLLLTCVFRFILNYFLLWLWFRICIEP